jgi:VIT1/CCC1 family predicted Fe2+/Mn2+ transporter
MARASIPHAAAPAVDASRSRSWHHEEHTSHRAPRLRAAVLGANDGLLSTSSLLVGVVAAQASREVLLATGIAALVSGAGSMANGEYSSVSSQRDAEAADLRMEAEALKTHPRDELRELTDNLRASGVPDDLAGDVARALTEHDALAAHARMELGIEPDKLARPLEAAVTSAVSFSLGSLLPILVVMMLSGGARIPGLVFCCLAGLAGLGALGARLGGAHMGRAALRVLLGGTAAMILSWVVGNLFDVAV